MPGPADPSSKQSQKPCQDDASTPSGQHRQTRGHRVASKARPGPFQSHTYPCRAPCRPRIPQADVLAGQIPRPLLLRDVGLVVGPVQRRPTGTGSPGALSPLPGWAPGRCTGATGALPAHAGSTPPVPTHEERPWRGTSGSMPSSVATTSTASPEAKAPSRRCGSGSVGVPPVPMNRPTLSRDRFVGHWPDLGSACDSPDRRGEAVHYKV